MSDPELQKSAGLICGEDGCRPITREEANKLLASIEEHDRWRREIMPNEQTALHLLFEAYQRLIDFGWRQAAYAPRDRRSLELIEVGSTGIHTGYCEERTSAFPQKWFWILDDDQWPSSPILYRDPNAAKHDEGRE